MIKKIGIFLKRVVFSCFFLYGYNLIASPLNLFIPINVITVLLLTILGIPSVIGLLVIMLLLY